MKHGIFISFYLPIFTYFFTYCIYCIYLYLFLQPGRCREANIINACSVLTSNWRWSLSHCHPLATKPILHVSLPSSLLNIFKNFISIQSPCLNCFIVSFTSGSLVSYIMAICGGQQSSIKQNWLWQHYSIIYSGTGEDMGCSFHCFSIRVGKNVQGCWMNMLYMHDMCIDKSICQQEYWYYFRLVWGKNL